MRAKQLLCYQRLLVTFGGLGGGFAHVNSIVVRLSLKCESMSGYSGTPLAKKLGIKEGFRIALVNAPANFQDELGSFSAGATIVSPSQKRLDLILFFAESQSDLSKNFAKLAAKLTPTGMLWIAWTKKSSGVPTDLSFEIVQETGLAAGLVDTKICAVNEVWSGLKFVVRVKDRP